MDGLRRWVRAIGCLLCAVAVSGCDGSDDEAGDFGRGGDGAGAGGNLGGPNMATGGFAGGDGDGQEPPPEQEERIDLQVPQASEHYVFAANPDGGTVAAIDAETLHIVTVETGARPTYLRTLSGTDAAIVLNVGSDEASIIRMEEGAPRLSNLDVVRGANTIEVSPDGKHAVVFFDANVTTAPGDFGDFQTVSVLTLEDGGDAVVPMTVGFKPSRVFFRQDGAFGYVVTESGVSLLDFAEIDAEGSAIADNRAFSQIAPDSEFADVSVTPDGRYALTRLAGESELRLLDLQSGETQVLDLADAYMMAVADELDAGVPDLPDQVQVTDLDLAPDGSSALAVLREQSAILRIPIPAGFEDPASAEQWTVAGEFIGLVEAVPGSDLVLAYTTALPEVRRMTVLSLDSGEHRVIDLRKSIQAVATAPDGNTALVIHRKAPGDPAEPGLSVEQQLDRLHGYTLMRPSTADTNLVQTEAAPVSFAIVPDSSHLFVLVRDDNLAVRQVHRANLTSLVVDPPIKLDSPPASVGAVARQQKVFVSQAHPEGRMTFIDWNTAESQTVTGFELNAKVRD